MAKKEVSIDQLVKKQIKKWEDQLAGKKAQAQIPVITVSMEPGSGGSILAQKIADRLEFDYFNRDIVEKIAKTSEIRGAVINSLEKERLSGVKDFISSLMEDQYIHPRHLPQTSSGGHQYDCQTRTSCHCRPGGQFYSSGRGYILR